MKDCTTCKYGYKDERLGIQMCHHPKRFSEGCVDLDFNMYEEKESEHLADARKTSPNDLADATHWSGGFDGFFYGKGYEQAEKDILAIIESRISEIIGDAQPKPALRAELEELINRIKDE